MYCTIPLGRYHPIRAGWNLLTTHRSAPPGRFPFINTLASIVGATNKSVIEKQAESSLDYPPYLAWVGY